MSGTVRLNDLATFNVAAAPATAPGGAWHWHGPGCPCGAAAPIGGSAPVPWGLSPEPPPPEAIERRAAVRAELAAKLRALLLAVEDALATGSLSSEEHADAQVLKTWLGRLLVEAELSGAGK